MSVTVVAEKPSVARDLARVLGATRRAEGYFEGGGYRVTWAVGHLVTLAEPGEMHEGWKKWRRDQLPMLPSKWPLVVVEKTREQFQVVKKLLTDPEVSEVVCATDAGREGELIFRYIQEAAKSRKPVKRLWISSLTDEAIRAGFRSLKSAKAYDGLADAARGRSCADWLVGMNLSRAYGLSLDEALSVGRVQTPTLAMIVERELAIRNFVPEKYREVVAGFSPGEGVRYEGTWLRPVKDRKTPLAERKRIGEEAEAKAIVERVRRGKARIASVTSEEKRMPPPALYDLTELQRHANRLFGFTAQHTLEVAQRLYETHKLLSYPRTDSRHLSSSVAASLPAIVEAIRAPYEAQLAPGTGERPLSKRHVDDAQVTDHHALIPTDKKPGRLDPDEARLYELVCRRLLQAWHADFVWAATTVLTEVESEVLDTFHSSGTAIVQQGWKALELGGEKKKTPKKKGEEGEDEEERQLPSGLEKGQAPQVLEVKALEKETRPPPRLSDATLLSAMETAGRLVDEKELSRAMKDSGLGTPATRAAIIETLLQREYVVRKGKTLEATDKGIRLVEVVDERVKSPVMTGEWEARLQKIERGEDCLASFLAGIEQYVKEVVGQVPAVHPFRGGFSASSSRTTPGSPGTSTPGSTRPTSPSSSVQSSSTLPSSTLLPPVERGRPGESLGGLLKRVFGFDSFRPHQEAVCRAASEGSDVLLVMPTGAGKSLCYQLPGLSRGGTTLVVSPLIALIEDQVSKLRKLGLNAERIHSGLDRATSRQVCRDYLDGRLDYLFIAPERLGVPGFPEMLAKRPPSLVAIDEAHCISQWGHDFRPDYRLLGQRLPLLRPAPIVAVTATATPVVQKDIVEQLGLTAPRTFIHGFRRTNLAIEVRECAPSSRAEMALALLKEPGRLPAILYAPTRKKAEETAKALAGKMKVAAYHAGLSAEQRDKAQTAFLSGKLDAVVATVAFGMGVDKADVRTVVHLALPGSVEGYYQEIGRAGRDGKESRAVLLHSWADTRTLQFFHERDYPEPEDMQKVFDALSARPIQKETVRKKAKVDKDTLDKVLERLWMAGAALITPEEDVQRGEDGWQQGYRAMRDARAHQAVLMSRYTESHECRMLRLVRHFGDGEDSGEPCGLCDACAPSKTLVVAHRAPEAADLRLMEGILDALRTQDEQSTGRLCRQLLDESAPSRRRFDSLVGGLVRAGLVRLYDDEFEKDGKRIRFQRVALTAEGRNTEGSELSKVSLVVEAPVKETRAKGTKTPKAARTAKKERAPRVRKERPETESPLATELRAWRLSEAKRRRVPAFRVFTDKILEALVEQKPQTQNELLEVSGIGPKVAAAIGPGVLPLCRQYAD